MTLTNADVRKALKGSIKKWKAIVAGTGEDRGVDNCPLCAMFLDRGVRMCAGCPVDEDTGHSGCDGSPYTAWNLHCSEDSWETSQAVTENDKKLAKAELDYLIGLDQRYFRP